MLNRSEIFHTAWAKYCETVELISLTKFSRKHFAMHLRMALADAQLVAHIEAQMAEEAAEAAANPARAEARAELTHLNMQDRWTNADRARASELHAALAA